MYASAMLPTTAALVLGAIAAPAPTVPRQNAHILDFRTYGASGCVLKNQGVYTKLQSDVAVCGKFADATIGSIFVMDRIDKCNLFTYTDAACTTDPIKVPVGMANCYNATAAGLSSYKVLCA